MTEPSNMRPYGFARPQVSPRRSRGSALLGFFLVAGLHLMWLIYPIMYFFLGLAQVVYVVPILIIFGVRSEMRTVAGAGLAAAITLLAQGIFCGALLLGSS